MPSIERKSRCFRINRDGWLTFLDAEPIMGNDENTTILGGLRGPSKSLEDNQPPTQENTAASQKVAKHMDVASMKKSKL